MALVAAACGKSDDDSSTATTAKVDTAAAQQVVDKAMAPVTAWPGPTSAPAALAGKKVGFISCAQAAEGCTREAAGAAEGARAIGWTPIVLDGQGDQQRQLAAMNSLIDQKVDAIIIVSINAAAVSDAMQRATRSGIPVISTVAPDPTAFGGLMNVGPDDTAAGRALAAYVATHGGGRVAMFDHNENPAVANRGKGFRDGLAEFSPSSKVVYTQSVTLTQIGPPEEQLMSAFLQTHPKGDVQWLFAGFDAMLAPLVKTADREGRTELQAFSVDGNLENLGFIRSGVVETFTIGYPLEWVGWAAIDELNRKLQNQPLVAENIPFRLLDKTNLPAPGKPYEGDFDFRTQFKQLWNTKA
jgi:ribose transport system substrate-binding protein